MLEFWLLIALMVAAGLALLLPPLLRPSRAQHLVDQREALLAAQRVKLAALKSQHALGSLEEGAYADARQELEQQVLEAAANAKQLPRRRRPARMSAAIVAIALPALSLWLYWMLGAPQLLQMGIDPDGQLRALLESPPSREAVQQAALHLDSRLGDDPESLEGWRLLARARLSLGDYSEAVEAMERALMLSNSATDDLVDYTEAVSLANEMRFPEMAQSRIEQALEREPQHPKALMLGALAAVQRGDSALAMARFRTLLAAQPAGSERARFLEGIIQRIQGVDDNAAPASPATDQAHQPRLVVQVSLAPELAGEVSADQRVFVFARAASGPPMPLAAVVLSASDLPAEVVLDDSTSMVPGRNLSSATEVVIGARISTTGSATPASGDLEGMSPAMDPGTSSPVQVRIDQRRP